MTPYPTVKLSDLLTPEQIKECTRILNSKASTDQTIAALKNYLGKHRVELEAKGVLPDYLAYSLIYLVSQEQ